MKSKIRLHRSRKQAVKRMIKHLRKTSKKYADDYLLTLHNDTLQ